jgi:hypothetical protein
VNSLLRDALLAADQSQPSIFDVSVALIAFDMSECRESKDRLLLKWLQIGAFPFDKIRDIIQRRSSNEVMWLNCQPIYDKNWHFIQMHLKS